MVRTYSQTPPWVDSFIATMSSHYNTGIEKEAEINVKSLPKVVWNNNTFYVSLDVNEKTADILNEYGNVVTTVNDAATLEDVEASLNKTIVADLFDTKKTEKIVVNPKNSLDEELNKIAENFYAFQPDSSEQQTVTPQNVENSTATTDPSINGTADTVTNSPKDSSSSNADEQMDEANNVTAELKQLQKENKAQKEAMDLMKKKIEKLSALIVELEDNIHAYKDPGNSYDLNSQAEEEQHYMETAKSSQDVINIENMTDLTTPYGRTQLREIIKEELEKLLSQEEILNQTFEEPVGTEDVDNLDNVVNILLEESPEEAAEIELQEEVPGEVVDVKVNSEEENSEDIPEDMPEEIENKNNEEQEEKVIESPEEDNVKIVKLNGLNEENFKKRICPVCKHQELKLAEKTASVQNIKCACCGQKFDVNLNTEEITAYLKL